MKPTTRGPAYKFGDVHGRGPHPNCPELGGTHWPVAAQHERADYTGKTAGFVKLPSPQPEGSKPREVPPVKSGTPSNTTTGLVTRADFLEEADRLKVGTSVLTEKIIAWFAREDVGEGMRRMQCNLLLRHAVKRKTNIE